MVSPRKRPKVSIVAGLRVATELSSALDSSTINRLGLFPKGGDVSTDVANRYVVLRRSRFAAHSQECDCAFSINHRYFVQLTSSSVAKWQWQCPQCLG
jgi:hypothetical protein